MDLGRLMHKHPILDYDIIRFISTFDSNLMVKGS